MTKDENLDPTYYRRWHLAKTIPELKVTEFEYAVIRYYEAFIRWVQSAVEVVSPLDIGFAEHLILHVIRMQNRPKAAATIARMINRDDIPNIQYCLRKLETAKLIEKKKEKGSKTFTYSVTEEGQKLTNEYSDLRSELLIKNLSAIADVQERLEDATQLLSVLTGVYEESGRISSTYNQKPAE
ncbi:winged helix DNA-binding protein [Emcibacter nanhaiensis]|uniref:winged helix DNA-binding protein n=1 Tax=Emcibacter nanhaiensis TaxID=1505037 RepID=UPI001C6127DA|nr:winged helix DNA-binding protein [Emcibacter nanhaiensis]